MPSSFLKSRSMYWYQPLYWPPGGASNRENRVASSSARACPPSLGRMTASAILHQEPSITAAPGSAILPSRFLSRRLEPCLFQALRTLSICAACEFGGCEPFRSLTRRGVVSTERTSCVAAAFIADVTLASDHWPFLLASCSSSLLSS